jgi:hypothetical protein
MLLRPYVQIGISISFLCTGVHRGILAMPQPIPIRIHVKPYVLKYVLTLTPSSAAATP